MRGKITVFILFVSFLAVAQETKPLLMSIRLSEPAPWPYLPGSDTSVRRGSVIARHRYGGMGLVFGYHYSDNSIMGFSHTHLSGTGATDYGDILFMPTTGELKFVPGRKDKPGEGYRSRFSHEKETRHPVITVSILTIIR